MTDTQLRLRIEPPFQPLPNGSAHYVAALQTKPGELDALQQATAKTWSRFTPLIQIVGPKSPREQIKAGNITTWTGNIKDAVGEHPMFLDILRLNASHPVVTGGGAELPVLKRIYWSARRKSLKFVPVVRVGESNAVHAGMAADAAEEDGRGIALRLAIRSVAPPPGMTVTDYLSKLLVDLRADVTTTDLLLDLAFIDPDTEIHAEDLGPIVSKALDVGDWRNVVLMGTSIPSMLSCVAEGSVGEIERCEWAVWTGISKMGLKRLPAFGDYAIQHPTPPQDGGGGSGRANIRYTTTGSTVVARGRGPWYQEGAEQYVGLCQQVVARPDFSGAKYTWGDGIFKGCASGAVEPGLQRMWRGAGTSHHLRFVTDQVASSSAA